MPEETGEAVIQQRKQKKGRRERGNTLTRPASKNSHSVSMSVGASLPVTQYFADKLLSISLLRVAQADAPFCPPCFARRSTTSSALWKISWPVTRLVTRLVSFTDQNWMMGRPSLVPRPLPDFISQIFLHGCEIKSGSGLGTRLGQAW